MDARIIPLAEILRMNTRLFRNCLDGMSEAQSLARPTTYTNSAGYVASHVATSRYYLLTVLGLPTANPLEEFTGKAQRIEDVEVPASLDVIRTAWTAASHLLRDRLESMTGAELEALVETRLPLPDKSVLSVVTFLAQHDSFHIGQLSLLRKYVGLPAMRYD